jgi:hypothetical protein
MLLSLAVALGTGAVFGVLTLLLGAERSERQEREHRGDDPGAHRKQPEPESSHPRARARPELFVNCLQERLPQEANPPRNGIAG